MSFINKIMGVVKLAAPIAANVLLPGAGSVVSGLMDTVLDKAKYSPDQIGAFTDEQKAEIIASNPDLMIELQKASIDLEAKVAEEKTKNMQTVGTTMQAELTSGRWYQRAWRPFNGFMFPIAVLGIYLVVPFAKATLALKYPMLALISIEVPPTLWVIWGGILGIAVHGRNQEKKPAGGPAGAVTSILKKFIK